MPFPNTTLPRRQIATTAGLLYFAIILIGLSAELVLRAPILGATTPAEALQSAPHALTWSLIADVAMVAADVALAAMLFLFFAPMHPVAAGIAALFRLLQASVLAGNLVHLQDGLLRLDAGDTEAAFHALSLHGAGYDLGLIFFGVSTLVTAWLVSKHMDLPRWLAPMLAATGLIYIGGTVLRVAAPEAFAVFQPAYLIAIISETAFASALLWLGIKGYRASSPASIASSFAKSGR